ncbi:MAG: 16S rRNA (cytosine(1402)-N(4))-methyltransferase RsmH [Caldisericia bacterium]|nr:16S rRNA (cytosine(1402)-N(4))-methyltransferase RsmH [Caldisericia bacterium]HOJ15676.1 16S rRNA (cytosine(1402)-N(4))-methyltransferase RsmH [Caldisericia bacterium]HOW02680.1 16S rRNA (cytosine(1402)-N(4))-methyltransferase RsmH [Caldisericia bacterium]HPO28517.1 16S rRNA (cytosine(1402)-N(4))-methyltransferase RsmH [Caldisericia bacterium]HQG82301.1 16S rRNA (cytosine(1402)-N(4))-methyltransferase RsmH [Caldisericia bacterium]
MFKKYIEMEEYFHKPVFGEAILDYLDIKLFDKILDCTCGEGGHSSILLNKIKGKGFLVGLDRDREILSVAEKRLKEIGEDFLLFNIPFSSAKEALKASNITGFDKVLVDLGLSMYHIVKEDRGFSFFSNKSCDMRYNRTSKEQPASYILNNYREKDISDIIFSYGEERMARKIANAIVEQRRKKPIETCSELTQIVSRVYKYRGKINPATKTFQALRIYVNSELSELNKFFLILPDIINKNGRVAIISYHSLEDRLVKNFFKSSKFFEPLNKKVIIPDESEIAFNKAARSAKLRVGVRL